MTSVPTAICLCKPFSCKACPGILLSLFHFHAGVQLNLFPGHALHEKGLQRQKGDVPLVGSQEERALLVSVTKRLSAAGQSRVLFLHRFTWDFACSCFRGNVQATCLRCFGGCGEGLFPRRTVLLANSPARPRPATPPCAPTRLVRGVSGFWIRQVHFHAGVQLCRVASVASRCSYRPRAVWTTQFWLRIEFRFFLKSSCVL